MVPGTDRRQAHLYTDRRQAHLYGEYLSQSCEYHDFEIDTIVGKGNCGAIVTLVEKQTNMLFMRKLKQSLRQN